MIYVFDSNTFRIIGHYFPERFPSFWKKLNEYTAEGKIISVREVYNELSHQLVKKHLTEWVKKNKKIFLSPTAEEMKFVGEIFKIKHFQYLVTQKQRLKGTPVADPFVIASAKINLGYVVTEEESKPNSAKIPNVCEHFKIKCMNLEKFMKKEGWEF